MNIRLLKLYSEPQVFDPINFDPGVNLILGEKVNEGSVATKKDRKTNGVGKSVCVEFINFCLLKEYTSSRVYNVPSEKFPEDAKIMLDLIINEKQITIIRTKKDFDKPIIIFDTKEINFSNLKDAQEFLTNLYFPSGQATPISFRELMGPIIRDEDCEFQNILHCYDTKLRIGTPDLAKPHLYFFGIDVSLVDRIKKLFKKIEDSKTVISSLEKDLTKNKQIKISDVKAEINSLTDQLEKISSALDSFKTEAAYGAVQDDLVDIQNKLDKLRTEQSAIKYEIRRIESLPKIEHIQKNEIEIVYNQFKEGLGDLVSKSLDEVHEFKMKIDEFQSKLLDEKYETLKKELDDVTLQIRELDQSKSKILKTIDERGIIKDLQNGIKIYEQKNNVFAGIKLKLNDYEEHKLELSNQKHNKGDYFLKLSASIVEARKIIESFNQTILEIHEFIMGTKKASFDIKTIESNTNKQIVDFEYRIDDDGSHSVDRTKVFIYDIALMFNDETRKRHPKMLIHDNIFDVDQDTLVQSLNYLAEQEEKYSDFQYILTLNRDKIENEERLKMIKLNIESHKKAQFTRQKKFLKTDYQEL